MTTKVIIRNENNSHNMIEVSRYETGLASFMQIIEPGGEVGFHVWDGSSLVISEGTTILRTYKNPKNLTGLVVIEEDGTIRAATTLDTI